jgi:hypothetical protein
MMVVPETYRAHYILYLCFYLIISQVDPATTNVYVDQ